MRAEGAPVEGCVLWRWYFAHLAQLALVEFIETTWLKLNNINFDVFSKRDPLFI